MGKLKTAVVSVSILAALGLSTGALMMAWMNRPLPPAKPVPLKENLADVAGYKPDSTLGDRVVKLSSAHKGGNASVEWTCGKKSPSGSREEHGGHWDALSGAFAYNAATGRPLGVEIGFATASFTSDEVGLTRTVVLDQAWFDTERFPEATFRASDFAPRTPETEKEAAAQPGKPEEGWTHLVRGSFSLNGVTKELAVPAKLTFAGESARLSAKFQVSRAAFKVDKRKESLAGMAAAVFTVDDDVRIAVGLDATPDLAVLVGDLRTLVLGQKEELRKLRERIAKDADEIAKLNGRITDLEERPAAGPAAAPVDLASLPGGFDDEARYPRMEWDTTDTEGKSTHTTFPARAIPFKMILVPGDKAKGIAPFYIGETEVTWDMFKPWSHWEDNSLLVCQVESDKALRPTNVAPYADTSHAMGYANNPAMGMSRLSAEKYCAWLSKQTGRKYRLPTEAEWELAYALGGGDPATDEAKKAVAWCKENTNDTLDDSVPTDLKTYTTRIGQVKTKAPNKLGVHDMLGNVAEWVKTPGAADAAGKNTFVRGGDFLTPAAELSGTRREESSQAVWNLNFPKETKSVWWFKDHYQIGFRLVCEPANLPKK